MLLDLFKQTSDILANLFSAERIISIKINKKNYKEAKPLNMFIRFNALVTTEIESRYTLGIKTSFIMFYP